MTNAGRLSAVLCECWVMFRSRSHLIPHLFTPHAVSNDTHVTVPAVLVAVRPRPNSPDV